MKENSSGIPEHIILRKWISNRKGNAKGRLRIISETASLGLSRDTTFFRPLFLHLSPSSSMNFRFPGY
jgi:hypothetical protein